MKSLESHKILYILLESMKIVIISCQTEMSHLYYTFFMIIDFKYFG